MRVLMLMVMDTLRITESLDVRLVLSVLVLLRPVTRKIAYTYLLVFVQLNIDNNEKNHDTYRRTEQVSRCEDDENDNVVVHGYGDHDADDGCGLSADLILNPKP